MGLAKFVVTGLAIFGAVEVGKYLHQKFFEHVSMMPGHNYAMAFNYTVDPALPATAQAIQSCLDGHAPGEFKVLTGALAPGPQVQARTVTMNVEFMGAQSESIPLRTFLDALSDLGIGTVTLASVQDMGVSPTSSGTAAAAATS